MKYGTAGFRDEASKIINISFKLGQILAHITLNKNSNFGIMITASHNKHSDNGIKIVDRNGVMINREIESIIEDFINDKYVINNIIDIFSPKTIFIGHDTRYSFFQIKSDIIKGIKSISDNIKIIDFGNVTTPQHHFLIKYNKISPNFYIEKFKKICDLNLDFTNLTIDCANGVGYMPLSTLQDKYNLNYDLQNINIYKNELLNNNCGSDYVITDVKIPDNLENALYLNNKIGCSIDGDGDRFIFYYYNKKLNTLDGDYIAVLYLLGLSKIMNIDNTINKITYTIGYIHTPYTNRAIIEWINNNIPNINIVCTAPGVKNLHQEALKYDLSVYFESNGHGTFLINNKELIKLDSLKDFISLNNEVVGDGISGIFCVYYFLEYLNINFEEWFNLVNKNNFILYNKIIDDKNKFKTNNIGDRLLEPINIQNKLDTIMSKYNCFCFIRPSGTENIIRIYIESDKFINEIKAEIDLFKF